MSFNGGTIFTNKGRALQAKAQAGAPLVFTRLAVGDGQLGGQAIQDLTDLIHEIKSLDINKLVTLPGGKAVVGGVLSNQDIVTGFYWRELGLFATDPDLGEILYCYGNAGALAEYIPSPGGAEILEKQVDIVSIVGNAASVSATIEQSLIYETPEGAQAKADAAEAAAKSYTDQEVAALAGEGNTKTVKQLDNTLTSHLADYAYQAAGGTATAITLTINNFSDGYPITFIASADNEGVATTINTKPLYKPNTTTAPNLVAGKAYTVWYDQTDDCFFIKASAEGNAGVDDVLAGVTFSNDNDTGLTGALVLTGTATDTDVANGKTYYNTDAKTIRTGTSTAKKNATGSSGRTYIGASITIAVDSLSFQPSKLAISGRYNTNRYIVFNHIPGMGSVCVDAPEPTGGGYMTTPSPSFHATGFSITLTTAVFISEIGTFYWWAEE